MKRHALFVGVNTYDDPTIRQLRYSVPDASVLADRFGRLGFKTRLLSDPTGPELLSSVEDSVLGLGPGDVFLFFFAGHGFTAQDGAHLLFCKNDRRKLLRVNGAGVRVDALEALTDDGGFHRAFLLDSCRTDCFAGVDVRGDETRDLDFVAVPDCTEVSGSFYLLRSCDKFRPSLELDDLGHGLFTQGLLDAMDARDGRLAVCDTSFAAAVRDQMAELQRRHHVTEPQRPSIGEVSGACFALFQEGFLATRQSASGPNLTSAPALVVCHRCGRRRNPLDTFRCPSCQNDFCLDHQDAKTFLCFDCAEKAREEAERKAAEELAKHEREEAERQERERKAREWIGAQAGERKVVRVGSVDVPLRWCPPGTFTMGSPADERGRYVDETQHRVTLTNGFWMGETPVTQELWNKAMKNNPSHFKYGDEYPVENVSWNECAQFFAALNRIAPEDGFKWDFPTEAQWEYACRAGTAGPYGGSGRLDDMGWYGGNSGGKPHPVGQRRPNGWGLFDMHGNVWEWCRDWYGDYPTKAVTDPVGPSSGSRRVGRGGSWIRGARNCRSADRDFFDPGFGSDFLGVRVALAAAQEGWMPVIEQTGAPVPAGRQRAAGQSDAGTARTTGGAGREAPKAPPHFSRGNA